MAGGTASTMASAASWAGWAVTGMSSLTSKIYSKTARPTNANTGIVRSLSHSVPLLICRAYFYVYGCFSTPSVYPFLSRSPHIP